jgi:hypothetical protein
MLDASPSTDPAIDINLSYVRHTDQLMANFRHWKQKYDNDAQPI